MQRHRTPGPSRHPDESAGIRRRCDGPRQNQGCTSGGNLRPTRELRMRPRPEEPTTRLASYVSLQEQLRLLVGTPPHIGPFHTNPGVYEFEGPRPVKPGTTASLPKRRKDAHYRVDSRATNVGSI